jgi:hypothetical protein
MRPLDEFPSARDAYAELGLGGGQGATVSDVRAAYKRLALERHPDKRRDVPSSEASRDFARLHDAFRVASADAAKTQGLKSVVLLNAVELAKACLVWMSVVLMHGACAQVPVNVPQWALQLTIDVTLEDVYHARVKKVSLLVLRYEGRDTSAPRRCTQAILIPLRGYVDSYEFPGMGDDLSPAGPRGSVHVMVRIKPHAVYNIDTVCSRYDLHVNVSLTPEEYYYGKSIMLPHMSGTVLDVSYPGHAVRPLGASQSRTHICRRHGLPYHARDGGDARGDLYVFYDLALPDLPAKHLAASGVREAFRIAFGPGSSPGR